MKSAIRSWLIWICVFGCGGSQLAPGDIAGTARYADAQVNAGIRVALLGTEHVAVTDDAGNFAFHALPAGPYLLEASAPGYASMRATAMVASGAKAQVSVSLDPLAATTGSIAGAVTHGAASAGNAGIGVALLGTSWSATTADDGSFRIDGVAPGSYSLRASADGFVSQILSPVAVAAGKITHLDAVALSPPAGAPAGTLKGRVTRAGAAAGNGGISVYLEGSMRLATTDDSGAFALDGVAPGTYVVAASAPGYALAESHGIPIADGQSTRLQQIDLALASPGAGPATGAIAGLAGPLGATDASGVSVTLAGNGLSITSITDASGAYTFTNLPVGFYTLTFSKPPLSGATLTGLPVLPGVFAAPPVVLYPGSLVSSQLMFSATNVPNTNKALLQMSQGTALYEWGTGALTNINPAGIGGPVFMLAPDGSAALVSLGFSEIANLNLADGTLTVLARMSGYTTISIAGRAIFFDEIGDLRSAAPGDTAAATVPVACKAQWSAAPLTTPSGGAVGGWAKLTTYGGGPSSTCTLAGPLTQLVDVVNRRAAPLGDVLAVAPDGSAALIVGTDASNSRILYRLDLATGASQQLRAGVIVVATAPAFLGIFSDADPLTHLGKYGRIDLATLQIADLLSSAGQVYSATPVATVTGGSPAAYWVLDFAAGSATQLCPVANAQLPYLYQAGAYAVCLSGTYPYSLITYDFGSATLRTLSTSATGSVSGASPHVLVWQESDGSHLSRIDLATGPALRLCGGSGPPAISGDEHLAVATCGATLSASDLTTGLTTTAATLQGTATFQSGSVGVTPAGRGIVASYAAGTAPGASSCGADPCLLILDRTLVTSATVPASPGYFYGPVISSAAPGDAGFVYLRSAKPLHVHLASDGPHVYAISSTPTYGPFTVQAWGSSGRVAVVSGPILSDADAQAQQALPWTSQPLHLGSADDWLFGSTIAHLADGTTTALGAGISVLGVSAAGDLVFRDVGSGALERYTLGGGITQLAPRTQLLQWWSYPPPAVVHNPLMAWSSPTQGSLMDVLATGEVHTLLASAAPQLSFWDSGRALAYANPDLTTGQPAIVDLASGQVTLLAARAPLNRFPGPLYNSTLAAFNGWSGSDTSGPMSLFVVNLDGSGLRALGPAGFVIAQAGSRLFFSSGGIVYEEPVAGGSAFAVDATNYQSSPTLFLLSPDGKSLLTGGSPNHVGTWRLELP